METETESDEGLRDPEKGEKRGGDEEGKAKGKGKRKGWESLKDENEKALPAAINQPI